MLYDDSAYVETLAPPEQQAPRGPAGLIGRQVAGKEFLDAYFSHGDWDELVALVYNQASGSATAGATGRNTPPCAAGPTSTSCWRCGRAAPARRRGPG
jgi:hypothetical protein